MKNLHFFLTFACYVRRFTLYYKQLNRQSIKVKEFIMSEEFDPQVICNFENNGFTVADIEKIARFQSYILYCVLANIVLLFAGGFMAALLPVVSLAVLIGMIISFVSLRNAMKKGLGMTVVLVILMFIPLVGLLILLVHVSKATKILRTAGLNVGLMGVSSSELAKLRDRSSF